MTGLQINKLLPGTNCKECGSSTCLAFAMKMAAKKAEIAQCPYASEAAKKTRGVFKATDSGRNLVKAKNAEEMFRKLGID